MRRIRLLIVVVLLWVYRKGIQKLLLVIKNLYRGGKLMKRLPGPGKEYEKGMLGHMTGPLFLEPGAKPEPEYFVEHLVGCLQNISKMCKDHKLYRSE